MTVNHKVTGTAWSTPAGLAFGGAVSLGITMLLSALAALMVLRGHLSPDSIGYCSMAILLLSAAAGSAGAIGKIKRCRVRMCMAAGAIYYGSLLVITALFFGGVYHGMGATALMVLCGSGLVSLLGAGSGGRRRGHYGRNSRK